MVMIKGQLILKPNCQVENSSKNRTNEFIFTTIRHIFFCLLEEIEDTEKFTRVDHFRFIKCYVFLQGC